MAIRRTEIECEWDCAALILLNVASEVEAVLGIEASLVAAACVLIEDIRKAQSMELVCGRESEKDWSARRLAQ